MRAVGSRGQSVIGAVAPDARPLFSLLFAANKQQKISLSGPHRRAQFPTAGFENRRRRGRSGEPRFIFCIKRVRGEACRGQADDINSIIRSCQGQPPNTTGSWDGEACSGAHYMPQRWAAELGHWLVGSIDWALLGSLLAGSLPGIVIGSPLSVPVPNAIVRFALASTLILVAGRLVL